VGKGRQENEELRLKIGKGGKGRRAERLKG
jgi:hypothetical protein